MTVHDPAGAAECVAGVTADVAPPPPAPDHDPFTRWKMASAEARQVHVGLGTCPYTGPRVDSRPDATGGWVTNARWATERDHTLLELDS